MKLEMKDSYDSNNEHKDFALEIDEKEVKEDGTFKGFASTFGGSPDSYGDVIAPGAFLKTLSKQGRNKNGIVMLKHHDRKLIPGVWETLMENKRGLVGNGRLLMDTQLGKETHVELKARAIKGLSIGFQTIDSETNHDTGIRTIKDIELFEISIVAFPANTGATITSVKDLKEVQEAILFADSERQLEHSLRDIGLTQNAAKYIISLMNVDLRDVDPEEGKPLANEHACRLESPSKFTKFRRVNNAGKVNGKRIDHIIGVTSDGKSAVQSIRYPKSIWDSTTAKTHCSGRGGSFEAAKEITVGDWDSVISVLKETQSELKTSKFKYDFKNSLRR